MLSIRRVMASSLLLLSITLSQPSHGGADSLIRIDATHPRYASCSEYSGERQINCAQAALYAVDLPAFVEVQGVWLDEGWKASYFSLMEGQLSAEMKKEIQYKEIEDGFRYKVSAGNLAFLKAKIQSYADRINQEHEALRSRALESSRNLKANSLIDYDESILAKKYLEIYKNKDSFIAYVKMARGTTNESLSLAIKMFQVSRLKTDICQAEALLKKSVSDEISLIDSDNEAGLMKDLPPDLVLSARQSLSASLQALEDCNSDERNERLATGLKKIEAAQRLVSTADDYEKTLDFALKNGNLIKRAQELRLKGWASGISGILDTEYISNKHINYLVEVIDDDTDYEVVQSSGRIARMESSDYEIPLIIDFGKFPPPREGATLVGRRLKVTRIGEYRTTQGTTRNAIFLQVVE